MGERIGSSRQKESRSVPKLAGMHLAARAFDRMPDEDGFFELLREDDLVRRHVRYVVEAEDARLDASHGGRSRQSVPIDEWRSQGFPKVVRFMEAVGLNRF